MTQDDPVVTDDTDRELVPTGVPSVPKTLDEMAALRGGAIEIVESRATVLDTSRKRSIRMTHPEDWTLFQTRTGRVTAYLSDAGCQRALGLWGIDTFNVQEPEKFVEPDGSFIWVQQASGRNRLTGAVVERIEGSRWSTQKVFKDDTGHALNMKVKASCRANMEGNIARRLMGLKNVPAAALTEAWAGTTKRVEDCSQGAGFGTQDERLGAARADVPDVPAPTCPHCPPVNGSPVGLRYRPAKDGRPAFYGCPNYTTHPNQKVIVNADEWVAKAQGLKAKADAEESRRLDAEIAARDAKQHGGVK